MEIGRAESPQRPVLVFVPPSSCECGFNRICNPAYFLTVTESVNVYPVRLLRYVISAVSLFQYLLEDRKILTGSWTNDKKYFWVNGGDKKTKTILLPIKPNDIFNNRSSKSLKTRRVSIPSISLHPHNATGYLGIFYF